MSLRFIARASASALMTSLRCGGHRRSDGDRVELVCHSYVNRIAIGWQSDGTRMANGMGDGDRMGIGWHLEHLNGVEYQVSVGVALVQLKGAASVSI